MSDRPSETTARDIWEILHIAEAIEKASVVEVHSGDYEPGARLTPTGRSWIVAGLRLLAASSRNVSHD